MRKVHSVLERKKITYFEDPKNLYHSLYVDLTGDILDYYIYKMLLILLYFFPLPLHINYDFSNQSHTGDQ